MPLELGARNGHNAINFFFKCLSFFKNKTASSLLSDLIEIAVYIHGQFLMKRDATGKFVNSWDAEAKQRVSVSLTNTACQRLDEEARKLGSSRSELIEQFARSLEAERSPQWASEQASNEQLKQELNPEQHPSATPIQEQADILNAILAASVDYIYVFDRAGRYRSVSQGAANVLGYEPAELAGKTWQDINLPKAVMEQVDTQWEAVMATEQPIRAEIEYAGTDGTRFYEYILTPWRSATQAIDGVIVISRDITDRKRVEVALRENQQHLEIALETAKLGAWQHDLTTNTLTCSAQCKANFGFSGDAEFTHETLFTVLHPEDRDRVEAAIQQTIEQGIDYEVEERCIWADGSLRWLIARGRLVYSPEGVPVRLVGVTLDITERKQFEESLKATNQQISNLLESITDAFIAFDRQWHYTYVNHEAAQMLGRSPADLIGRRWQDVFPDITDQPSIFADRFQQAMTERATVHFEGFSLAMNRWLETSVFPSEDGIAVFLRDISDRKRVERWQAAQYAVARVLAEATTLVEAVPSALQALCENLEWQFAVIWSLDQQNQVLRYVNSWHPSTLNLKELVEAKRQTTFAYGVGLPGRIWKSQQPAWIANLTEDGNFPNATASGTKALHAGFGFPIRLGDQILGVIEGFGQHLQEPDENLLQMMGAIGSQVGQFMERKRTEEALQQSQALFQSFMSYSPTRAYIKDEAGRYLYVSPSVERAFDRQLEDWVGKTDFDFFSAETAQQYRENDLAVLTTGKQLEQLEMSSGAADPQYFMSFKFPLPDSIGHQLIGGMSIDVTERIQAEAALKEQEQRYRRIFETVGVSLWEEDFSEVKAAIDQLKAEGIQDFHQYFADHPEFGQQMIGKVRVIDVNQTTLRMFGAQDKHQLLTSLHQIFLPETEGVFIGELLALAEGKIYFEAETTLKTLQGESLNVIFTITFPPLTATFDSVLVSIVNITDRKQAEEHLRLSENRYRTLANAVSQLMWVNDPAGNVQFFNQRWQEYTGVADLELGVGLWRKVIHPDDLRSVQETRTWAIAAGEAYEVECRLRRFDQTYRWHLARIVPLKDDQGQVLQWYGTAMDIDDVKQTEAALRASEAIAKARAEELETFMETVPAAVWIAHDPQCHQMTANRTAYALLELPPGEVATATPAEGEYPFPFRIQKDGQDIPPDELPMQRAGCTGQGVEAEFDFVFDNSRIRSIWGRAVPLRSEAGEVRGVIGAFLDISERKRADQALRESEERYRQIVETANEGIWIIDASAHTTFVNQKQAQMFGYSVSEMLGRSMYDFMDEEAIALAERNFEQRQQGVKEQHDFRFCCKDGSAIWTMISTNPIFNQQGAFVGALAMVTDITDRKRAEQEREQLLERERLARQEAEAANRVKDEFLAVLSHELRTPLNPILGWAKLLRSRQFDASTCDRALETIERNAKLQTQLIEDLLDVSRILQGKLLLNTSLVDLTSTITAAIETVRLSAEAKSIQIQTIFAAGIGQVSGDANRLQQVFWNLLSNAVKFTPAGGQVEIALEQVGSQAQIRVTDTGKGIEAGFLPFIFDYFRQADSSTTRTFGGLGLGLAIVRHLVELHGGTVEAASSGEGQGSTFLVRLPCLQQNDNSIKQETGVSPDIAHPASLSGLEILVVDDDADMRAFLAFTLKQYGANVTPATSAKAALTLLSQLKPNVVISDIGMPEMDGYTLMRQVRNLKQGGEILAIALTAYAGEIDVQRSIAAGFQHHISKPVEPEELVQAILSFCLPVQAFTRPKDS